MNFSITSIFILLFLALSVVPSAHAAVYGGGGIQSGLNQFSGFGGISSATSVPALIGIFINFLLSFVLLVGVAAIIIAGIYLIVSNGDEANKDKAKNIIFYVAIGIVLILLARVIVLSVNNAFG
jgi:hypothetical protein